MWGELVLSSISMSRVMLLREEADYIYRAGQIIIIIIITIVDSTIDVAVHAVFIMSSHYNVFY